MAQAPVPTNWRVIEFTESNIAALVPEAERENFLNQLKHRLKSTKACGFKATKISTATYETFYPETVAKDGPHNYQERLFLLVDVRNVERDGYGILAIIFVHTLIPSNDDIRFKYNIGDRDIYVLPAWIDWTCGFVSEQALGKELKEKVKANLTRANVSVAKYITNEVSRLILGEYISSYPENQVDGLILLSYAIDEDARKGHRRNGKYSACNFPDQFSNPVYGAKKMLDIFNGRDLPFTNMYNFYTSSGQAFAPGNELYDYFRAHGADLEVRASGTNYVDEQFACSVSGKHMTAGRRKTRRRVKRRRNTKKN
jgi:hypothetical protein